MLRTVASEEEEEEVAGTLMMNIARMDDVAADFIRSLDEIFKKYVQM